MSTTGIAVRSFPGASGTTEHYITVEAPAELSFADQLRTVERRYAEAQRALNLDPATAVFRRVFVSDVLNQIAAVQASPLTQDVPGSPVAVSLVQQQPLPGSKIALLAYHVDGAALVKRRLSRNHVLVEQNGLGHLWSTRLCAGSADPTVSAEAQTRGIFDELVGTLSGQGGTLRDHCVRTWIYVKDVDVFYHGMVKSRIAVFDRQGLTADTHYIASTGIEGACAHQYDVVSMDAYSVLGMAPEQMSFLNDFEYMCPTKDYNVTFERGTRIAYADRAHSFISGTASIDKLGQVVHPGDVIAQLGRALENVEAILKPGAAALADMTHLLVYVRDTADHPRVEAYLAERLPLVPTLIVRGAVCRPEWLIEVEGVAVSTNHAPGLPRF
ncbi:endoribonuclease L-PSP [Azospirillum sp. TSO22-1]|nr:endoribonuclease L-PSP [Azospirillum sp. TSO22-1]